MTTGPHLPAAVNHDLTDHDLTDRDLTDHDLTDHDLTDHDLTDHDLTEHDPTESLTPAQKEALERAVAKIVTLGAQVGVSVDQMIELLRSGLTVRELLEFLAARSGEVA